MLKKITPILLGTAVFLTMRPFLAKAAQAAVPYEEPTRETDVKANKDGFNQVVFTEDGRAKQLSESTIPNADPSIGQHYVTWMGQTESGWEIFVHDLRTRATFQLTHLGNNVNPTTDGEMIAWEAQENGVWVPKVFTGQDIVTLPSENRPIQQLQIEKGLAAFLRKSSDDRGWQAVLYDVLKQQALSLPSGEEFVTQLVLRRGVLHWQDLTGQAHEFSTPTAALFPVLPPVVITPPVVESPPPEEEETPTPIASSSASPLTATPSATLVPSASPTEVSPTPAASAPNASAPTTMSPTPATTPPATPSVPSPSAEQSPAASPATSSANTGI